ncbi:MAG: hypothetical protein GXO79_14050 [Chlorobi bacterium]|nr:hypothetical protein [Chlorobiota bacterium]
MNSNIEKSFSEYIEIMFQVGIDLQFWNRFLNNCISKYQETETTPREIFTSLFGAFNIDLSSNIGFIKIYKESKSINTSELQEIREKFFSWVINCSIVKTYIAVETAFTQTIWVTYFSDLNNPLDSRKNYDKLSNAIKSSLKDAGIKNDTKNNRHIIEFLKLKSYDYNEFLKQPIRSGLNTDWSNFFELLSILRNIVSHIGSKVSLDLLNEIKGNAKDIFERHFTLEQDKFGFKHFNANQEQFGNFLNLVNDYTLNTLKIILKEKDFNFLRMK